MSDPAINIECEECGCKFVLPITQIRVWEQTNGSLEKPPDIWAMYTCPTCRQWLTTQLSLYGARQLLNNGALHTTAQTPPIFPDARKVEQGKQITDDEILDFGLDLKKKSHEEVWEALMSGS